MFHAFIQPAGLLVIHTKRILRKYNMCPIYIYIEREVDKSVSLQRCIACYAAALIFCCKARFWCRNDSKSYCTRKMAASQSRTVHSKTHRVCPIHTINIGPIGPLSSTIPSPWIESLHKGRSHMQGMHDRELLYKENGCVATTYGTFQDPQGLSYPHKKYWTHRSIIQYYTITLNRVLTQRQVSYAMHDSKSYCTRIMAASQSQMVHSKTHRVCPIHTRNIGPIGRLSSTISPPWIESLPKGRFHIPCMIQRATVPGKWLRLNHVRYIPRPIGSVLSTQEILEPSVHYPVL